MSGKKSRNKGYRGEYSARKLLESLGYTVTWQAEDPTAPDLMVWPTDTINPGQEGWEVKYGSHVPKTLYQWFSEKNPDVLLIKRVKAGEGPYPWLVVREFGG